MRRLAAILCVLLLVLPEVGLAGPGKAAVPWEKLEPLILGERVTIHLPDSTVDGRVIAINSDSLRVDGMRSGTVEIPRASLTTIAVHHHRRYVRPLAFILALGTAIAIDQTLLKNHRSAAAAFGVGLGAGFGFQIFSRRLADGVTVIHIAK